MMCLNDADCQTTECPNAKCLIMTHYPFEKYCFCNSKPMDTTPIPPAQCQEDAKCKRHEQCGGIDHGFCLLPQGVCVCRQRPTPPTPGATGKRKMPRTRMGESAINLFSLHRVTYPTEQKTLLREMWEMSVCVAISNISKEIESFVRWGVHSSSH